MYIYSVTIVCLFLCFKVVLLRRVMNGIFHESITMLAIIIFTFKDQDLMIRKDFLYMHMVHHFNAD